MEALRFCKTRNVQSPSRGTPNSAGIDFYVPFELTANEMSAKQPVKGQIQILADSITGVISKYVIHPGKRILIPSGIKVKMPKGYCGIFFNKSGVAAKSGVIVGSCVVDSDYQGEVHLSIINTSDESLNLFPGTKLVQMLVVPESICEIQECFSVNELYGDEVTDRGTGGFGSTGTTAVEEKKEVPAPEKKVVEAKQPAKQPAKKPANKKASKKVSPSDFKEVSMTADDCARIEAMVDSMDVDAEIPIEKIVGHN